MKKNQEMKIKLILVVISVLLIGVFLGRIGLSQTGNALKSVVEPGSMTTEASYIVFTDGTDYYARNGTTGEIEFSSTNASQVIQNAINQLTSGGKILIKTGTYELSNTITIPPGVPIIIEGEGHAHEYTSYGPTTLRAKSSLTGTMIDASGTVGDYNKTAMITLRDITLDGNQSASVGLNLKFIFRRQIIDNVAIVDCGIGLKIDYAWINSFRDLYVNRCNEGIHIEQVTEAVNSNFFTGGMIENAQIGILIQGSCSHNSFVGMTIEGCNNYGVRILRNGSYDPNGNSFVSCWFENTNSTSVDIQISGVNVGTQYEGPWETKISSNFFTSSVNKTIIQLVEGQQTLIEGNSIDFRDKIPIIELQQNNVNYHYVKWNIIENNLVSWNLNISDSGYQTSIKQPTGADVMFRTENSGNSTVSNNDWIAHGLATTPTIVTLTPRSNATVWVNNRNATHFQVGVSSGAVTIDWHAEV